MTTTSTAGPTGTPRTEDDLLMAVIHDIRRHLRTSIGRAQLLERELGLNLEPLLADHLNAIIGSGKEMNVLLSRLAQYVAAGSNKGEQPSADICVMFDSALRRLNSQNKDADIDALPLRACGIQAPYSIETVLRELLDNALKFREGPVKITVLVEHAPEHHVFGIKDSGIGFDPQYCERIMLPLERLHPPDTYSGCGLGLAICQRTLAQVGGKLWAESKLNGGSTFWFTLPV